MAGCASPGICTPVPFFMPTRLRVLANTRAVSPMAKISGWPGTERSGFTLTLPDLSASAPSQRAAGEAVTPAVHSTVRLRMRLPLTTIPSASTLSTRLPVKIFTPNCCI